jgi:hypothetical protein
MHTNRISKRADWETDDGSELEVYPFAAAMTCLMVGIGVGMAASMLMTSPPRQPNIAERVGHQILEGLRSITPQSWSS